MEDLYKQLVDECICSSARMHDVVCEPCYTVMRKSVQWFGKHAGHPVCHSARHLICQCFHRMCKGILVDKF